MSPFLAQIAGSKLSWTGETVLDPVGFFAIVVLGIALLLIPRRNAVIPMILMACFVAPAQRVAIFGLNFDLLRVMVLFGTARLLIRHETGAFVWNRLDFLIVFWTAASTLVFSLQYMDAAAIKNRMGFAYDALGMYFLFRMLIRDWEDVCQVARASAVVSVPVAAAFAVEHVTGRNLFAFMGGVPAMTDIRDGRLRCQGAFAHPILAGCFWASLMPLIAALWWRGKRGKIYCFVGLIFSMFIVVMCASSTPLFAVGCAVVGMGLYKIRHRLRAMRWGFVGLLFVLQLFMNNPVWHLIARMDVVGGSTGWHRYHLIDETINHFSEWWLLGTRYTGHWGYGLEDVTNQYVLEAVRGGAVSLSLFIALIFASFWAIGRTMRRLDGRRKQDQIVAWGIGVGLFVHCMNFLAVSYFGQIFMLWYLTLAMIGSLALNQAGPPSTIPSHSRTSYRARVAASSQPNSSVLRFGDR